MQFLAPLFLSALAALSIPLYLHLRRDRPSETVPFSALMFLERSPIPPVRRRALRNLLLLILRCLALALLAFVFARPFLEKKNPAAVGDAEFASLILLDTSASLRGPRMAEARREALALSRRSAADGPVAFATFSRSLSVSVSFADWARDPAGAEASITAQLEKAEAGWFDTHLGEALTQAAEQFALEPKVAALPARLYVVSDFQRGADRKALEQFEWPDQVEVIPVTIGGGETWTNAGVHPVTTAKERRVTVFNSVGSQNRGFRLSSEATTLEVPPGEGRPFLPREADPKVILTGDDFDFDNTAWLVPDGKLEVGVRYLGKATADDSKDTLFFLTRALQPTARYNVALDAITPPALVVLDGVAPEPPALGQAETALGAGTPVLLVLRKPGDAQWISALTKAPTPPAREAVVDQYALFGEIDFTNPILQPFADSRFGDFSRIHTWRYRTLDLAGRPEATVLIRFDSGNPALLQIPAGKGFLYVLTTTWAPGDSQLALSSKFAPLIHSLIARAPELADATRYFLTGETVQLPAGVARKVRTPGGEVVEAAEGRFSATNEPGLYSTEDGRFSFAVNVRPSESEITPLTKGELTELGVPLKRHSETVPPGQKRTLAELDLERGQKIWWWLSVGALAILFLETTLAAWSGRRAGTAPNSATS